MLGNGPHVLLILILAGALIIDVCLELARNKSRRDTEFRELRRLERCRRDLRRMR